MSKFLISVLLVFCGAFSGIAQSYYFKHYQADDGLAHNTVFTIAQGKNGMLWIGTKGGLNSFDGYSFKTYKNHFSPSGYIGNNVITALAEDQKGMLWIGTGDGAFFYNPQLDNFKQIPLQIGIAVSHIVVDRDNKVWLLANERLMHYDPSTERLKDMGISAACMSADAKMNLWLGGDDGSLSEYNTLTGKINRHQIISSQLPISLRVISKILPTGQRNEILIGTIAQGLKSYNTVSGKVRSLLQHNHDQTAVYVRDIVKSKEEQYWVATESGIYIYNALTGSSQNLKKHPGDAYSLNDNAVYCLYKDLSGDLWAGTFFGGLNYYSNKNARFQKFYPIPGANSLSGSAVREIVGDKEHNLWIGTEDAGLNKLEILTGKITNFNADGKRNNLSYPNIHGLLSYGEKIYMGTFQHGMEIMDRKTGRITDRFDVVGHRDSVLNELVVSIYLTADSTILVGTTGKSSGLYIFHPNNKTFSRVNQIPADSYVFDIKQDHEGNIWTGSVVEGAYFYNPLTGLKGKIHLTTRVNGRKAGDCSVPGIHEDRNHNMWFTTEGGGLVRISPDRKTIKTFTIANGMPTNNLLRMLEDETGHLWISSLKGLIRLDMRTEKIEVYTQSNGLITDQFNYSSAYKDFRGRMYFGSVRGMIAFDPAGFGQPERAPETRITNLQVNNHDMVANTAGSPLKKSILYTDSITLQYDQANLGIEFAAMSYSSPKVVRYRYLMKGLDKEWTYLKTNRRAYFTDLAPGNYMFIVKAKSNVGTWEGQERKLYIQVLPPFWKSTFAYIIYILTAILVIYLMVRYYRWYLDKENQSKLERFEHQKDKEVYQAKIEFFTNIAHEIQTPLTLIIGPVEMILKKIDTLPGIKKSMLMIEKNARRLAELTDQLLDFRKTEINQYGLNFVNADISAIVLEQSAAFEQEAEKEGIVLHIELPKAPLVAFVDPEAFVKILSNLISNAIKYASGRASIQLLGADHGSEMFTIRISNDGRSIPPQWHRAIFDPFFRLRADERPGTGIGLSLARSLTELHNGSLQLICAETDNIVFELNLPIHQKFEFRLSSWKKI